MLTRLLGAGVSNAVQEVLLCRYETTEKLVMAIFTSTSNWNMFISDPKKHGIGFRGLMLLSFMIIKFYIDSFLLQ